MNQPPSRHHGQTGKVARVLAGIIAAFILLISLPAAVYEARDGTLGNFLMVVCCAAGGIGLALGARTGRWFNSPA